MQSGEDLPVCVIGCGFAGLSMCRQLLAHKIPFIAYDQAPEIGGLWRGVKQMYEGLSTNLPLQLMAFGGVTPPPLSSTFCGKEEVMSYLKSFVSECKLQPFIRLNTVVLDVQWTGSVWKVKTQSSSTPPSSSESSETKEFRSVIVCSGHFYEPLRGALEGFEKFSGKVIHSSEFTSPSTFSADQRVLVVGSNSSGSDIATMLKQKGCDVHVYMRTGSATPEAVKSRLSQKPKNAGCIIHRCPPQFLGSNKIGFDHSNHSSISLPTMPFFQRIFFALISPPLGRNNNVQNVCSVESKGVYEFDTVVLATGYRYTFPFLNNATFGLLCEDGIVTSQLFEHMFYIPNPTLAFIGLGNALVPPSAVFHFQSLLVARVLSRKCQLPAVLGPSKFPWWLGFQTPKYCNELARLAGLRTGYWWDFFIFKFWRLVLSALLSLRQK